MKLSDIITKVSCKYGAPLGRANVGIDPYCRTPLDRETKIYDRRVPLFYGGYDKGGAYWGIGNELRVRFTKDLTFIQFYRTA